MGRKNRVGATAFAIGAAFGLASLTVAVLRSQRFYLKGKTVFVTGGSRGLGLLLAQEFASRGAQVAISSRDREELERAASKLRSTGAKIFTIVCDVTMREEVNGAIEQIGRNLGPIDVLVNNAGTICVGPMDDMTIDDYRDSINTHFWGPYFATAAVLPEMQKRREGRIVNISSIGGKISVPHLLPYSVGKFALTGFSEGLRSEALKDNVHVTTVCPGLMRTGSPRNALFKGDNEAEYAWFSISDSLPLLSMSPAWAARRIVNACVRGDAELVLSLPAKLAVKFRGLFPEATAEALSWADRLLPAANGNNVARAGSQSFSNVSPSWVTTLNERAAATNNEI